MRKCLILVLGVLTAFNSYAEDGHELWLRYSPVNKAKVHLKSSFPTEVLHSQKQSTYITAANELEQYWRGGDVTVVADSTVAEDGYRIKQEAGGTITIEASTESGVLYAAYAMLRGQAMGSNSYGHSEADGVWSDAPAQKNRYINHWDNLDGTIERGYAGRSIFWHTGKKKALWLKHIADYSRANASIGINGCVINNVNASPKILTKTYIDSVSMIAGAMRPYGIKVFISVNFGSPKALGATTTADPLDESVRRWWKQKVKEIYRLIPDFGGFLVKANSEGQPGPFDYGRSHSDGANMLAEALAPYGGKVMWRSFVYGSRHKGEDRVKQAVSEFADQDGKFLPNVILQSKNGPLDFQPREPVAPIFYKMKNTPQMAEFQITQEYTGQSRHLVYLGTMWREFFDNFNSTLLDGIAGVSNVGSDTNWCGHPFSQANWYAFGRMAWNPTECTPESVAKEWICQTFTHEAVAVAAIQKMMMSSRETCTDYMMPMGLHHIFKFDHHYGPEPDGYKAEYPLEWCPVYYHKADSLGIGFDRTMATGSGATEQYPEPYRSMFENLNTCPDEYLLWFHHLSWKHWMKNGRTLWDNLCLHYNRGVKEVDNYRSTWASIKPYIDIQRWQHVDSLLDVQQQNAREWKDTCLGYFQTFSKMPVTEE